VSDQVGIQREITRANAGIVVGCNANEVSQAIQQALNNDVARNEMAQNGRRLAQEFAPPAVTARLLETYRLFARKSSPSAPMQSVPLKHQV
jgi:glycosyltransferase involved in cell wall biosynthesis